MSEISLSPFAKKKQERLLILLKYIADKNKVDLKSIFGKFCIEWGLRQQKLLEYLTELQAAGYIRMHYVAELGNPIIMITQNGLEVVRQNVQRKV